MLDPNAAVEDRFINYTIEMRDGRSLSGIINSETAASLVLVGSGGQRESVLRSEIQEIRGANLSLMPEGLEMTMKPQDFADLIAFLQH